MQGLARARARSRPSRCGACSRPRTSGSSGSDLLEDLARRLVDEPDAVRVEREERDDVVVLRLFVAKDDVGKVIGRQGRIARALRQVVRAAAGRQRKRVVLEIVD